MASITHAQQVCRLYRKSLKHLLSWTVRRNVWRQEAVLLRAWFDQNKHVTNMKEAKQLLKEGEDIFWEYQHPDPYIHPEYVDGSSYERNTPPPDHALWLLPEERKWLQDAQDYADYKTN